MTKKMLSLVLVLAMVLTLFAGLTLTTHAADGTYTQVTDASTLAAGDTILLAKADSSAYAGAMGTSAFFTSVASQADAIEITLSGDSTGWTFTTSEGTIGTSAAKKLNHTGTGTTTWTISIDSDGLATIASTNSSYGKFLYNNTSPRFLNYTSNVSSSMQLPIIYKKDGGSSTGHTHSWGDWYTNNDGTHSRDCDDPDGDCPDPTQTADCTYGATTVVTAATCSSVGSGTHTCTVCGYTETVEIPVDANAHNWEWDGNEGANGTHGLECANCGATSTEACVDTDDDDVCDICGADIPALTTATGDIVFSTLGLTNAQQYTSFNSDNGYFTVSFGDGTNDGKYYNTGTGIRVYSKGHMTVAATTGTITKIEFTCSGTGYMPTSSSTVDPGSMSFDGTKTTWTGDAASVTFTREQASNHWRIQSISVTVSLASGSHVHSWGAWYPNNDGTHSRDCDDPDGDCPDPTETANCTYGDITVVTPATCSSVGSGTHTCTVCGYTETVEIPVDANAHVWEWDGNEGANGTHGTVCNECGATSTEACVDTDDDSICDVCGADMPEVVTYTLSDELHDGDKVVIYHPTSGNAISVNASGTKLAAVAVSPSNGELVVEDTNVAIFTVAFVDDTNFTLVDQNGNYLTSGQTGNSLSLGAESDTLSQWYLSTLGSSKVGIRSTGANYNGNYNQALEYYNGFTTYGWKDNNNAYIFELYTVVSQSAHVHDWDQGTVTTAATCTAEGVMTYECTDCGETKTEPIPMIAHVDANSDGVCDSCGGTIFAKATALNEGDQVVIYNPASGMAMTKTASGTRLAGLATNAQGGVAVTANSDLAVLTVAYDDATNFYLKDADGNYLTTAETGNSLTLEATATDYSLWYLSSDETGITIINKNAVYNEKQIALEFYGSNFTGYSMSAAGNAFYMELYTLAAPAAARDLTATYSLSTDATITINMQIGNLEDGDVIMLDSNELTGVNGVYSYDVAAKDINEEFTLTAKDASDNPLTLNGADSLTVSVRNYVTAEAADATVGQDNNTTVADVVKTMGNYGEYAKKYFTERDGGTYDITALYDGYEFGDTEAAELNAFNGNLTKASDDKNVIRFYGASLLLESETTLRVYFKTPGGADATKVTSVKVDGADATAAVHADNDEYIYVDIKIAAADLDHQYAVEIVYDGVTASVSGYSALRYVARTVADTNADANLVALCKALFMYYKAANGYFG